MAVTTLDRRVVVSDADTLTNWTGADTLDPVVKAEGSNSVCVNYDEATGTIYYTPATALNLDTDLLYVQSYTNALQNGWKETTLSDSSHMLYMNDGTNELALCQAGSDRDVFKHSKTQVQFQSFLIDLDYLSTKNTNGEVLAIAGSVASFVKTSVDNVGSRFVTLSKALGGGENCFVDIIRIDEIDTSGDSTTSTSGIFIYGGTTGDTGTFAEIVSDDESVTADKGFGVIREYTAGTYGCQGILKFGTTNVLSDAYFNDSDFVLNFENRDVNDDKYKIFVFGNSTNTNSFVLNNGTIVSAGPGVELDMDSTQIDTLSLTNITFKDLKRVVNFPTDTVTNSLSHTIENNTFDNCGKISPGTVDFDNNTISNSASTDQAVEIAYDITALNLTIDGYEGTAGTGALNWNVNADPDGNIDGSSFTKGTAATHAIEFSDVVPSTMTIRNCDFSGYNASDSQNDSTFYFADTAGTITVYLVGCTGNFTYRSAGATIVLVPDPVTLKITTVDADDQTPVTGSTVLAWVTDGTNFPYKASVTITGAGTTATVSHTNHGLDTGDNVWIEGPDQENYYGAYTITKINDNSYSYTTAETITVTPATGTITSTFCFINGLTDSNGEITDSRVVSSDQDFAYRARKSTVSPLYRSSSGTNTVDSQLGREITVNLISDE